VDPVSLDPSKGLGAAAEQILLNTFEGLYLPSLGASGPRLGVLKEEATSAPDGMSWTLKLSTHRKWSDGKPVTAHDFVFAWKRVADPKTASPLAEDLHMIRNGESVTKGDKPPGDLGVKALDDHTLHIELEHPVPSLPQKLTSVAFLPVREDKLKALKEKAFSPENWVSNGAYILETWALRQRLKLVKNPHYPDLGDGAFQCGEWIHVEDSGTGEKMFWGKQLDLAQPLPPESIHKLKKKGDPALRIDSTLCTTALVFNLRSAPTNDPKLREAIAKALDRKQVVDHILKRGDEQASTVFPGALEELVGYKPPPGIPFDPAAAKEALNASSFKADKAGNELRILYNSHDINQRIAESLQGSIQEHLGLEVGLENVEWKTFLDRVNQGNFTIARFSLCGMSDPLDWAEIFKTGGGVNWAGFSDPKFDERITTARQVPTIEKQLKMAQKAEKQILSSYAVAPLFFQVNAFLLRPEIRGYSPHPSNIHLLKDLFRE
jgi:oligopeptide transport system substrate-binding protein